MRGARGRAARAAVLLPRRRAASMASIVPVAGFLTLASHPVFGYARAHSRELSLFAAGPEPSWIHVLAIALRLRLARARKKVLLGLQVGNDRVGWASLQRPRRHAPPAGVVQKAPHDSEVETGEND
jgi:hypothetical protein